MKGKPTKWSNSDIAYLKENFPHKWNKDLATYFNLGWRTIVRKARELGLEKAPDFREHIDFTSFSQGSIPWNKGIKGKVLSPGCEISWFKSGDLHPMKNQNYKENVLKIRTETFKKNRLKRILQYEKLKLQQQSKKTESNIKKLKLEFKTNKP